MTNSEQSIPASSSQTAPSSPKTPEVIFLGNGPLADATLETLAPSTSVIFHAHTKSDLEQVKTLKKSHPTAHVILASFGVLIKQDLLNLCEPEGILNLHPSLLPAYRGPSPIESAILNGDQTFGVSIMELGPKMDAGPIYHQIEFIPDNLNRPDLKSYLYKNLAALGATWLTQNLENLPTPVAQDDKKATYTKKLDKSLSRLHPETTPTPTLLRQIQAYQDFPKPKHTFFGQECIILAAHPLNQGDTAPLTITGSDGQEIAIDLLQPAGKKPMPAKSFLNGYGKLEN